MELTEPHDTPATDPAEEGSVFYRCQWTNPGHFAPKFHDFRYRVAADNYAAFMSELGYEHIRVDEIEEDA